MGRAGGWETGTVGAAPSGGGRGARLFTKKSVPGTVATTQSTLVRAVVAL
eukprot:COSAG06_NODE_59222_length_275_cov_0.346591_1_plen_49_part_10